MKQVQSIPEIPVVDSAQPKLLQVILRNHNKAFSAIKDTFVEFCITSGVDCIRYLSVHGLFRGILWLFLFIVAFFACYFHINLLLSTREIVIVNEKSQISTLHIPFPAVTICSAIKADHRVYNHKLDYLDMKNRDQDVEK